MSERTSSTTCVVVVRLFGDYGEILFRLITLSFWLPFDIWMYLFYILHNIYAPSPVHYFDPSQMRVTRTSLEAYQPLRQPE